MALTLSHVNGSRKGQVERFSRESVLIGRGNFNDVTLDPFLDATVSAQHAEIRVEDDLYVLYDMGSLNGTFVNGHMIRRAALQVGDEISLGRTGPKLVVNVRDDLSAVGTPARPNRTADVTPKTTRESIAELESVAAPVAAHFRIVYWIALLGAAAVGATIAMLVRR